MPNYSRTIFLSVLGGCFGVIGFLNGQPIGNSLSHLPVNAPDISPEPDLDGQCLLEAFGKLEPSLDWDFDGLKLPELMGLIESRLQIPVKVDALSLARSQFDSDARFTGCFSGAPTYDALSFVLSQHGLVWRVEGHELVLAAWEHWPPIPRAWTVQHDLSFLVREHVQGNKLNYDGNKTLCQLLEALERLVQPSHVSQSRVAFPDSVLDVPHQVAAMRTSQSSDVHFLIWKLLRRLERLRQFPHDPASWSADDKVWQMLLTPGDWQWNSIALPSLVKELSTRWNVPVWIDRNALETEGIDLSTVLINGQFSELPCMEALLLVLIQHDLTLSARNGTVVVTTLVDAERQAEVMLFDLPSPIAHEIMTEALPSEARIWPLLRTILTENTDPHAWDSESFKTGRSTSNLELVLAGSNRIMLGVRNSTRNLYLLHQLLKRLHEFETNPTTESLDASAVDSSSTRPPSQAISQLRQREMMLQTLSETGDWNFTDQSLDQFRDWLQQKLNRSVWIDRRYLSYDGIDPEPIRFKGSFRSLSLYEAIRQALSQDDKELIVLNFEHASLKFTASNYAEDNCWPMIFVLSGEGYQRQEDLRRFQTHLEATVHPDVWQENGGYATCHFLPYSDKVTLLFIYADARVHFGVKALLDSR